MARVARILSVALITAGLVILADAGATLAWKEPVSAIYSQMQQRGAEGELDQLQQSVLADDLVGTSRSVPPAAPRAEMRRLASKFERRLADWQGKPIGKIDVPDAGIKWVVVEGTDQDTLRKGPGHYPDTALPGLGRTVGIAGHRTTYGAPFHDIDEISDGDKITLEMPYGKLTYAVTKTKIVEPTDVQIVRDIGRERLVLTACHPLYSAAERYAIFAELERVDLAERA